MGVPTWPNGFDLDAIKLHMDMAEAGELKRDASDATGIGPKRSA